MSDKPADSNFLQLPQDMAERQKLFQAKAFAIAGASMSATVPSQLDKPKPYDENDMNEGRFDIIPSNAIQENYLEETVRPKKKKPRNAYGAKDTDEEDDAPAVSKKSVSADNYRQLYVEDQTRQKEEAHQRSALQKLNSLGTINAQAAEQKKESEQFERARKLEEKIQWWQNQSGQGTYDDGVVNTTVDELQRELAGMADSYKR